MRSSNCPGNYPLQQVHNWIETPYHIIARFVMFMAMGMLEALGHKKLTRKGNIVRGVLFLTLMVGCPTLGGQ